MICRQCGIRIPERYLTLESFVCPECGKRYYRRPEAPQPVRRPAEARPVVKTTNILANVKRFLRSHSMLLLIALVIGVVYLLAQYSNISNASNYVATTDPETAEELGVAIGTAIGVGLLMPHVVVTTVGAIFNCIGWLCNKRWAAITSGILYAVGGALGFTNFFFVLVPMILCFVAASKFKKNRGYNRS